MKNCLRKFKIFKNGFTLAEVLITLVIVGVIAALTIPTAINNYHKKQTGVKLKKFYSVMSQALSSYYSAEGINPDFFEFNQDIVRNGEKSLEWFNNSLGKYIVTVDKNKQRGGSGIHYWVIFNDGSGFTSYINSSNQAYFFYCTEFRHCKVSPDGTFEAKEIYDGRTSFLFQIQNGKFSTANPTAGRATALANCKNPPMTEDAERAIHRHYCSRLVEIDGWEIKDDYPWYPDI